MTIPRKQPRIVITVDPALRDALLAVREATGTTEPDATLVRRLALDRADELYAPRSRRNAAEALFAAMDAGRLDLDLETVDSANEPPT